MYTWRDLRVFLAATLAGAAACAAPAGDGESVRVSNAGDGEPLQSSEPLNMLSPSERDAGWRLLFDGETAAGWRGFRTDTMPSGWQAVDGALVRVAQAGDIITVEQFENFELALEWRVEPGGNSGILYRVSETTARTYESGPEMQVLDDERHADGASPLTSAGSAYALYPAPRGVVRGAGEWNQARLVVDGAHVEHWLNGEKIVEYELWSPDWQRRVRESKFNAWPEFGQARRGHIGLQDHGDRVAYRNIKIRVLPGSAAMESE